MERRLVLRHDLDAPAGKWTREEAIAFNKALTRQRTNPDIIANAHYRKVGQIIVEHLK